jgi:hypothetical protein
MQTIKDYVVFSSSSQYRPSPLSQYQAEALSVIASALVRIIFGLHLHIAPAFALSCRRCFCLEDLRRRRSPTGVNSRNLKFMNFEHKLHPGLGLETSNNKIGVRRRVLLAKSCSIDADDFGS